MKPSGDKYSNNNDTTANDGNNRKSYIYLPRKCSIASTFVNTTTLSSMISWKVKSGSIVRKGELVGYVTNSSLNAYQLHDAEVTKGDSKGKNQNTTTSISLETKETTDPKTSTKLSSRQLLRQRMKSRQEKKQKEEDKMKYKLNDEIISPSEGILEIYDNIQECNDDNIIINVSKDIKLGHVEPCTHTTIFSGLCAICGTSIKQQEEATTNKEENNQQKTKKAMSRYTIANGLLSILNMNDKDELSSISNQYLIKLKEKKKLLLVLDLDHTLVHATSDIRALPLLQKSKDQLNANSCSNIRSLSLPITETTTAANNILQNHYQRHTIKLRPYLKEIFHPNMLEKYEIGIYTAGTKGYASKVTNVICRYILDIKEDEDDDIYINKELVYLECCYKDLNNRLIQLNKKDGNGDVDESDMKNKENISIDSEIKSNDNIDENEEKNQNIPPQSNDNDEITRSSIENLNTTSIQATPSPSENDLNGNEIKLPEENQLAATNPSNEDDTPNKDDQIDTLQEQKDENSQSKKRKLASSEDSKKRKKRVTFNLQPQQEKQVSKEELQEKQNLKLKMKTLKQKIKVFKQKLQYLQAQNAKVQEFHAKIFGSSRIISRNETIQDGLHRDIKSIKKFFPNGNKSMVVCIDDREDVWANCVDNFDYDGDSAIGEPPGNLLWVKPYHWKLFLGFLDVNTVPTSSSSTTTNTDTLNNNDSSNVDDKDGHKDDKPSSSEKEEKENDCQLLHTCGMLRQLHSSYYNNSNNDKNVNDILSKMRKNVLGPKTVIVFSGLVPLHKQNQDLNNNKARPSVIRYAQDLGAVVEPNLNSNVTHVVAAKDGTDKIARARKFFPDVKIVNVTWLYECYWSMTLCDVTPFLILPTAGTSSNHNNENCMNDSKKKTISEESSKDKDVVTCNNVSLVSSNKEQKSRILLDDDDDTEEDDDDDLMLDLEKEMMDSD